MKTKKLTILFLALLGLGFTSYLTISWEANTIESTISFKCKNANGSISGLEAKIVFDKNDLAGSSLFGSVDVNTIKLGNGGKTGHAKSKGWFHVAEYPKITYESNSISYLKENMYMAAGSLDLHGVKKDLSFPFKFTETENGALFEGTFKINRRDFNLKSFGTGNEITVFMKVPATKK